MTSKQSVVTIQKKLTENVARYHSVRDFKVLLKLIHLCHGIFIIEFFSNATYLFYSMSSYEI